MQITLFARAATLEALHEGRRAQVYDDHDGCPLTDGVRVRDGKPCIGHPTVGIGCNLDRDGVRAALAAVGADYDAIRSGRTLLTSDQIDGLFNADLLNAIAGVRRNVPDFDELPQCVELVLVDMTFNMGSVAGFSRMLAAIGQRDWEGMIREMLASKWHRDVPTRVRHNIELLRKGLAQEAGDIDVTPFNLQSLVDVTPHHEDEG